MNTFYRNEEKNVLFLLSVKASGRGMSSFSSTPSPSVFKQSPRLVSVFP